MTSEPLYTQCASKSVKIVLKFKFTMVTLKTSNPVIIAITGFVMELLMGIEPMNLILTKDALCRLSYSSLFSFSDHTGRASLPGMTLATQNGLEPSASSVTGWRSNQLNYWAVYARSALSRKRRLAFQDCFSDYTML